MNSTRALNADWNPTRSRESERNKTPAGLHMNKGKHAEALEARGSKHAHARLKGVHQKQSSQMVAEHDHYGKSETQHQ